MRTVFLGLLALTTSFASAQTRTAEDPISTVRPRMTDTTRIMPVGKFQLEAGLDVGFGGLSILGRDSYGEGLLRYGITPRLEARLSLPSYTDWHPLNFLDGFGDVGISASYLLGRIGRTALALRPSLTIPTGSRYPHVDEVAPAVFLTAETPIRNGIVLASTVGYTHVKYDAGQFYSPSGTTFRRNIAHATFAAERPLQGHASIFAEYVGDYIHGRRPDQVVNVGLRLRLSRRSQVDARLTLPFDDSNRQNGVGVGYAVRF